MIGYGQALGVVVLTWRLSELCLYGCLQLFRLELDGYRLVDWSAQLLLRVCGVRPVRYRLRPSIIVPSAETRRSAF